MATRKNDQKDATAAYFESIGVKVDSALLEAPPIEEIRVYEEGHTTWIDKTGEEVDTKLVELYRVDTAPQSADPDITIAEKRNEGFEVAPKEAGFRMRGVHTDHEVILMRTPKRKTAWDEARRRAIEARTKRAEKNAHRVDGLDAPIQEEIRRKRVSVQAPE